MRWWIFPRLSDWIEGDRAWEKYGWKYTCHLQYYDYKNKIISQTALTVKVSFPKWTLSLCEIHSAVNIMCVLGVLNMTFLSAYLKVSSSVIELTFGVQSQEILQMREPKGSLASSMLGSSAFGDISSLSPFIKLLFGLACIWLVFSTCILSEISLLQSGCGSI